MKVEMCNVENTILREIADKRVTRKSVAMTYAFGLRGSERDSIDWLKVNTAIIERWSPASLKWIKEQAWTEKCFSNA